MKNLKLSVVIPAYNEEDNIKSGVLQQVYDYLKKQKYSWEVLIVDDQSTDATIKAAKKAIRNTNGFRILEEPHRGKGGTVIAGMLAAKGQIVLFTDMDQATPLSEIEKFFPKFEKENSDVVIGVRSGRSGAPLSRKVMAWGFSFLRNVILRLPHKDTQCGFKAFTRDASEQIFSRLSEHYHTSQIKGAAVTAGFDIETLFVARKLGLKISESTVVWKHQESRRVSPLKDAWRGLLDLLRIRINDLQGKYNV